MYDRDIQQDNEGNSTRRNSKFSVNRGPTIQTGACLTWLAADQIQRRYITLDKMQSDQPTYNSASRLPITSVREKDLGVKHILGLPNIDVLETLALFKKITVIEMLLKAVDSVRHAVEPVRPPTRRPGRARITQQAIHRANGVINARLGLLVFCVPKREVRHCLNFACPPGVMGDLGRRRPAGPDL